jgi:type 1 glutamine amidotransferase
VSAWATRSPLGGELGAAIAEGVGFVGLHGICDSFHSNLRGRCSWAESSGAWSPMPGARWSRPQATRSPGLDGVAIENELYYVFVDQAVEVLAVSLSAQPLTCRRCGSSTWPKDGCATVPWDADLNAWSRAA